MYDCFIFCECNNKTTNYFVKNYKIIIYLRLFNTYIIKK